MLNMNNMNQNPYSHPQNNIPSQFSMGNNPNNPMIHQMGQMNPFNQMNNFYQMNQMQFRMPPNMNMHNQNQQR